MNISAINNLSPVYKPGSNVTPPRRYLSKQENDTFEYSEKAENQLNNTAESPIKKKIQGGQHNLMTRYPYSTLFSHKQREHLINILLNKAGAAELPTKSAHYGAQKIVQIYWKTI